VQVRKVRGPLLDNLYARLMRCGNLACTGKPSPNIGAIHGEPRRVVGTVI
jgi:hypothetical protein